jgi:hypothetical protein
MNQIILTSKQRLTKGLYFLFLKRMYDAYLKVPPMSRKKYLGFKDFTKKICRSFSIPKSEAFEVLKIFEEFGYISFVKFKGIKLNYKVIDNE